MSKRSASRWRIINRTHEAYLDTEWGEVVALPEELRTVEVLDDAYVADLPAWERDDDPFLPFQLRGRSRQDFRNGVERTAAEGAAPPAGRGRHQRPDLVSVADFWSPRRIDSPEADDPTLGLPASLPEPGWWRGKRPLTELLGRVYEAVAAPCDGLGDG